MTLTKTVYTEEEVKKVLRSLLSEKKKTQELEDQLHKLASQSPTPSVGGTAPTPLTDPTLLVTLNKKLSAAVTASSQASEQVDKLKKLVVLLKKKLDQETQEKEKATSLSHENGQLLSTLDALQQQKQTLEESLRKESQELQQSRVTLRSLEKRLQEATNTVASSTEHGSVLQRSYQALEKEHRALTEQNESLQNEFKETQNQWRTAKGQLSKAQELLRASEQENIWVEKENGQLKAIQEKLQEQLALLQNEFTTTQDELKRLTTDWQTTRQRLTEDNQRLSAEKAAIAQDRDAFKATLEATQKKYEETNSYLTAAQEQQQNHKKQNEQLVVVLRDKEQRIALLTEFETGYKKLISQKRDLETALQKEGSRLQQQHEELMLLDRQLKESQEAVRTLEPFKASCATLQQTQEALQIDITRLNAELTESETQVSSLIKEKEELRQQHEIEFQWQAAALQKAEERISERTETLEELSQDLSLTKQTLVRGMRELKALEERYLDAANAKVVATVELQRTSQELQKKSADNELLRRGLSDATSTSETLKTQNSYLQQSIEASKAQTDALQGRIKTLEEQGQTLTSSKASLQQELESAQQQGVELQTRIESLEQHATVADQEKTELQRLQSEAKENLSAQQNTILSLKDRVRSLEGVIPALEAAERQRNELADRCNHLNAELQDIATHLQDTAESRDLVSQQLQEVGHLADEQQNRLDQQQKQLLNLEEIRQHLEEDLHASHGALENKDALLKELQQQFKKKVQDNAYITEQLDAQKVLTGQVQNALDNARAKIGDMESQLQERQQQETRLQQLLNESIKSAESQVSRWEEKYLHLYDKWQQSEQKGKELKKFEQKYKQMAALLSDLGTHITSPIAMASSESEDEPDVEPPTRTKRPENALTSAPAATSTSLFDGLSQATHKVKNTLF